MCGWRRRTLLTRQWVSLPRKPGTSTIGGDAAVLLPPTNPSLLAGGVQPDGPLRFTGKLEMLQSQQQTEELAQKAAPTPQKSAPKTHWMVLDVCRKASDVAR